MKRKTILSAVCIVVAAAAIAGVLFLKNADTAYEQLRKDGYLGTPEQLLASLVGELYENASAYDMARGLNYRGSAERWAQTLTGRVPQQAQMPVFEQMRSYGYEGGFALWLESLVPEPELLGHSDGKETSEYELACQYGFEGTFAQWLISLVGYQE